MNQMRLPSQDKEQPKNTKKHKNHISLIHFERFPIKIQKKIEMKKRVQCDSKGKKGGSEQMTVEKSNLASSAYSLWHMSCRRP